MQTRFASMVEILVAQLVSAILMFTELYLTTHTLSTSALLILLFKAQSITIIYCARRIGNHFERRKQHDG